MNKMLTARQDRRDFMRLAGAAAGGATLYWSGFASAFDLTADLVVHNAKVYTVDPGMPVAEAFAVRNGAFVAVGKNDDIKSLIGKSTKAFDAQQMTVVPGFVDCHNHAGGTILLYEVLVGNPFEVEFVTIESIIGKLREKAAGTPPGYWVRGYFYDDTKVKDGRLITRHDLDNVSTEHPVVVRHRGGHTSFYNTRALELAGVTRATPNPQGGTFDRDRDGDLTGRVTDRANAVFRNIGKTETFTPQEEARRTREGLAHISRQFARYGLTSVHHQSGDLAALQDVRRNGDLHHRVNFEAVGDVLEAMIDNGLKSGFGDEWIRLGATFEHAADGSFSERTMAMTTPHLGTTPPYYGNVTYTQEELNQWVERVHRAGIQVNVHANGDVAIDMTLTAYERARNLFPARNMRPKITHCTLVNDDLVRRMKALDAVPAVFTTYAYYNSDKFALYGEETMRNSMAFRTFLDAGIHACAGSDFSPGPFAPLMGIQGMVTRTGWDGKTWGANQRVSVDEAILINTYNGAYASFEEDLKGSIAPGKLADFVVLEEDPHSVDPERIKDIKIHRTTVGGRTTYQA